MAKETKWGKLPKAFKNKWVRALRSGKYKQGQSYLKILPDNDGQMETTYCCLGVACEITGSRIQKDQMTIGDGQRKVPEILRGEAFTNNLVDKLTCMNDGGENQSGEEVKQRSFRQIATWIEKNL